MAWNFIAELKKFKEAPHAEAVQNAAKVLVVEFERLEKQKCAYCNGFGHSGNDCPTDHKISHLRGGVLE